MQFLHNELLKYFNTIRHLKLIQLYTIVKFAISKPKLDMAPAPPVRPFSCNWKISACREPCMIGPSMFRFLNKEDGLDSPNDWNNPAIEILWLYNLHYFDDLNALDAPARRKWHEALIENWIRANPLGRGIGWEPYPLSRRIVNWIKWVLAGNTLSESVILNLAVQVRYLCKRLEYHLLGNHLIANAKALVFAGSLFCGVEAEKWLTKGVTILSREIPRQIAADGGHLELSPMYHSIVLEDLLDLYNLARCYPSVFSRYSPQLISCWEKTIQNMRYWLKVMCHQDGQIALFNDAALGIALPPAELDAYALRMGLGKVCEPQEGVTHLKESGYIRFQNSNLVAILDVGAVGPDYIPGHAHADTLTFEMSLYGSRVIVNSGTSTYEKGRDRQLQRSTAAHNTVVIDGLNSSEVWSSFRVGRRARTKGLRTKKADGLIMVKSSHDGYRRLRGGPIHSRKWCLGPGSLRVEDTISGRFSEVMARYHFHPELKAQRVSDTGGEAILLGGRKLYWNFSGGHVRLLESTYHPEFGLSIPNQCLEVCFKGPASAAEFSWV